MQVNRIHTDVFFLFLCASYYRHTNLKHPSSVSITSPKTSKDISTGIIWKTWPHIGNINGYPLFGLVLSPENISKMLAILRHLTGPGWCLLGGGKIMSTELFRPRSKRAIDNWFYFLRNQQPITALLAGLRTEELKGQSVDKILKPYLKHARKIPTYVDWECGTDLLLT